MTPLRPVLVVLAVFYMFVAACSSDSSPGTSGGEAGSSGASSAGGGGAGQSASVGSSSSAGASGQAGASGDASSSSASGQAGSSASGGKSKTGGASSQGGTSKSGGTTAPKTGGASGGRTSEASAGRSGSAGAGGTSTDSGGTTTVSTSTGGNAGGTVAGGTAAGGTGGATSTGTSSGDAAKSAGCGKTPTLKGGKDPITIQSSRKYYLRIPDGYDNTHPYRLVFTFAESGSSAQSVMDRSYFRFAGFDAKNTVFVAPDAANGAGSWSKSDVELTDKILEQVEGDLCIDKTRIFASGFSFGGGMAIALACTRADVFRGVAFWSGADLTNSCPATLSKPIAYWASQASGDSSGTPMPTSGKVKQAQFAAVNGCTEEPNALDFPAAGQPHTCTVYKNCSAGHPTIYCVFNGAHGWEPKDPGQNTSWAPKEAWDFITQF